MPESTPNYRDLFRRAAIYAAKMMISDLPLTVSAVTRETVADLDGTKDAARRAEHNRCVVFNRALDARRLSWAPVTCASSPVR